jgi:hypothetical protein
MSVLPICSGIVPIIRLSFENEEHSILTQGNVNIIERRIGDNPVVNGLSGNPATSKYFLAISFHKLTR